MKVKDFFEVIQEIVYEKEDELFTAWLTGRNFEKWLQLEVLTKLTSLYGECWDEFDEYFHSEYRADLDQRGNHGKLYKQVDLYLANGKNDSNDYMYIELKTGFGKYSSTPISGVIDDLYWLKKIKESDAKERIAVMMLLSCDQDLLNTAEKTISTETGKKPSFSKTIEIIKENPKTKEENRIHVLTAIWKA